MSTIQICKVKEPDVNAGTILFSFSTNDLDRDSEVVMPMGVVMTNFAKNPVFLWSHDRYTPAIGRVLMESVELKEVELSGLVKFDRKDPFADLIFNKYAEGFLNATSIGFRPLELGPPVLEGQRGATIRVWEWMESSAVNIPANPLALRKEYDLAISGKYPASAEPYYKAIKTFYERLKDREAQQHLEKQIFLFMDSLALEAREKGKIDPDKVKTGALEAIRRVKDGGDDEQRQHAFPEGLEEYVHHDFVGGKYQVDWDLLRAAMVRLLSDESLDHKVEQKIYDHLAEHYREFGKEPPELTIKPDPGNDLKPRSAEELITVIPPEEIELIIQTVIDNLQQEGISHA
ncbi:MAG: hypothetical protein ONB55_21680 [candidate division KSB1 bacterium]|nr:hypothetical protein [candidate division KSB1 bacterium]